MREIILDTETTGLDPLTGHRLIEIGALEMKNRVLTGAKFHYYINPEREVSTEAYRIHGISSEFLKNKPLFVDIAAEFLDFIGDSKLVIHNAQFDIKFINHELSLLSRPSIDLESAVDTLMMARKMFPGMKNSLDSLCKRFNVDNSSRKFHGALKDAGLLAAVYVELTGGRQGRFNMLSATKTQQTARISGINISTKRELKVIAPTKEELKRHNEFLEKLTTNPAWLS